LPKIHAVENAQFARCPYDQSPIESESDWRGPALLSCTVCGAVWEWNNASLRRIQEPDRAAVLAARAGHAPAPVIREAPDRELAAAMWREVQLSADSTGPNATSES
jgi:hypothetical protein